MKKTLFRKAAVFAIMTAVMAALLQVPVFAEDLGQGVKWGGAETLKYEVAEKIYAAAGSPKQAYVRKYTDLKRGDEYAAACIWAAENEIIQPVSETEFGALEKVTREDVAIALYNYAAYLGYDVDEGASLAGYEDADKISGSATEAVKWCLAWRIIEGTGEGNTVLDPEGTVTLIDFGTMAAGLDEALSLRDASHVHSWHNAYRDEPVYETVEHPAVTHEENRYVDYPIYKNITYCVCNMCGYKRKVSDSVTGQDPNGYKIFGKHTATAHKVYPSTHLEYHKVQTGSEKRVVGTVTVIDEPEWTEEIQVGTKKVLECLECDCGARYYFDD